MEQRDEQHAAAHAHGCEQKRHSKDAERNGQGPNMVAGTGGWGLNLALMWVGGPWVRFI